MLETALDVKKIAVIGNPNTGKTSLFNQLTGHFNRVANYPGCTVTSQIGRVKESKSAVELIDLPGTYSLSSQSPDEAVVMDALCGRSNLGTIDAILVVVDASHLTRNLYLVSQLLELKIPLVMALNMMDQAKANGKEIDTQLFSKELNIPVIVTNGRNGKGSQELIRALDSIQAGDNKPTPSFDLFTDWSQTINEIESTINSSGHHRPIHPMEIFRCIVDEHDFSRQRVSSLYGEHIVQKIDTGSKELVSSSPLIEVETKRRYDWINQLTHKICRSTEKGQKKLNKTLDKVLTHNLWGSLIMVIVMALVFQSVFSWAGPVMDIIDSIFGSLASWVNPLIQGKTLNSLIIDGVIGGVGSFVIFLPQILMLFLFLSILEDSGYMARVAFLTDKIFRSLGLSGRSALPLLSSFACAIPGVMAAKVIENRRDRLTTIFIAPFMSCSARLPVYVLLISSFVPASNFLGIFNLQGVSLFLMYFIGILLSVPVAFVLKKWDKQGQGQPLILELPPFQFPNLLTVFRRVFQAGKNFVTKAGTIIFSMAIVVWALAYFPRPEIIEKTHDSLRVEAKLVLQEKDLEERLSEIDQIEAAKYLEQSFMGRMGHQIEPLVKPLGWDWRIGVATIASFPAREIIVSTLGTLFNLGSEVNEESGALKSVLKNATWPDGRPLFNLAVAFSIMVFFALCQQCMATLATIAQETNSWKFAWTSFLTMTTIAYVAAFVTYQISIRIIGVA